MLGTLYVALRLILIEVEFGWVVLVVVVVVGGTGRIYPTAGYFYNRRNRNADV